MDTRLSCIACVCMHPHLLFVTPVKLVHCHVREMSTLNPPYLPSGSLPVPVGAGAGVALSGVGV